jgi:vacuolar-type H+-ATPase subunit I/STV1
MYNCGFIFVVVGILMLSYASYKYHGMPVLIAALLGPIEGIGMMPSVISYVRLFAVGVAGVKIAETGNDMLYGSHDAGMIGVVEELSHHDVAGLTLLAVLLPVILPFALNILKVSLPELPFGLNSFGRQFLFGFLISGGLGFALGVGGSVFMLLTLFFGWLVVQVFAWILGLVSPNIHTARLHLVEWMKQFYEAVGDKFEPFGFTARVVEVE